MKSKKALFAALDRFFGTPGEHHLGTVANETFGRQSMLFPDGRGRRRELEDFLEREGFRVFRTYHPAGSRLEVQVSYFKGWHWDE